MRSFIFRATVLVMVFGAEAAHFGAVWGVIGGVIGLFWAAVYD